MSQSSIFGGSGRIYRRNDEQDAEAVDPFAMGYDAGADLDDPPACPFTDGLSAQLWRKGFSQRVDEYIADKRRWGGLGASIS